MPLISYGEGFEECPFEYYPFEEGIVPLAVGGGIRYGEQHDECRRCGTVRPLSQLRIQPGFGGGVIVCIQDCYDYPSREDLKPDELPTEGPLSFVDEEGPSE